MNDINQTREETNDLAKQAYYALRADPQTKDSVRDLENLLSTLICDAERLIQQSRKDKNEEFINEYYRRRTILKRIADGLAWIIFDLDSEVINACSIGHQSGFMAGKKGYKFERHVVAALSELPNVRYAIQCDITNVLRLSDILVVFVDGKFSPIEVKGRKSGRALRQQKHAQKIIDYIRTGEFDTGWDAFAPLRSFSVPVTFEQYFDELEKLSEKAIQEGLSYEIFDDCVLYAVINTKTTNEQDIMQLVENLPWKRKKVTITSLERHMSKDAQIIPRTRFPLTIFPITPELGLKYILGELNAVILLDKNRVLELIRKKGLEAKLNDDGSAAVRTILGMGFRIMDAWDKVLNEVVSISSFVDYVFTTAQRIDDEYSSSSHNSVNT